MRLELESLKRSETYILNDDEYISIMADLLFGARHLLLASYTFKGKP